MLHDRYEPVRDLGWGLVVRDTVHDRHLTLTPVPSPNDATKRRISDLLALRAHPSLATVRVDIASDDGVDVLADHIDGSTLQEVIDGQGPLDLATALEIASCVASAIEHLSDTEWPIVHGAVAPNTVVVGHDRRAVLVGGIAPSSPVLDPLDDVRGLAATLRAALCEVDGSMPGVPPGRASRIRELLERATDPDPAVRPRSVSVLLRALEGTRPEIALPTPRTRFVGRAREFADLDALLRHRRLVTITGTGGAGKTRLAIEVSRRIASRTDGVEFADLISGEPASRIATVLGASPSDRDDIRRVVELIASRALLLVLDGAEVALDETAAVVEMLLAACPALSILATSRIPLGLVGEQIVRIGGLPAGEVTDDAVRLLTERSGLGPDEAPHVQRIASRLDGLPLALELAAATIVSDGIDATLEALDAGVGLGTLRGLPERHRSLAAVVDHSYGRLDRTTRLVLRVASLARGRITPRLVTALTGLEDTQAILEGAERSSMLEPRKDGWRMLDPIREQLRLRLESSSDEDQVVDRFIAWAQELVDIQPIELRWGAGELDPRILDEEPNLLAALEVATDRLDDRAFDRFADAIASIIQRLGRRVEAATLLHRLRTERRAVGRELGPASLVTLAWIEDARNQPGAIPLADEAIRSAELYGYEIGRALVQRWWFADVSSSEARRAFERALAIADADGDPAVRVAAVMWLADADAHAGRTSDAQEALARGRSVASERALDRLEMQVVIRQIRDLLGREQPEAALRFSDELLELALRNRDPVGTLSAWNAIGLAASAAGEDARSKEAFRNAADALLVLGETDPDHQVHYGLCLLRAGEADRAVPELRRALDEARREAIPLVEVDALRFLAVAERERGELERGRMLAEEALRLAEELEDRERIALAHEELARSAAARGDIGEARMLIDRSIAAFDEMGDRQSVAVVVRFRDSLDTEQVRAG